jgi:general secretion pathway protein K
MPQIKNVKGSALLTALFIMTLVAIVATAMSTKTQLDIYRTQLLLNPDKLYLASQAVSFWALAELSNGKNKFSKASDQGVVAQYPKNMTHIDNSVNLNGDIYDLQARFNLNSMVNQKSMMVFMNLIKTITPQAESAKMKIALAVSDWISNYDLARGKDNYSSYYQSLKPPYYPSHQLMASASELRLVKDVSGPIYLALAPFITVLPEATPVNINTASIEVLKSLCNTKNESQINELITARKEKGIKDLGKVAEILKKLDIAQEQITVESNYFLSVGYASSNNFNLTVYTLLKRTADKNGKISVNILRESINTF